MGGHNKEKTSLMFVKKAGEVYIKVTDLVLWLYKQENSKYSWLIQELEKFREEPWDS